MDPLQKKAMTLFISLASVIYAAAFIYCYLTGKGFAAKLILGAVGMLTVFIVFLFRSRPEKNANETARKASGK